LNVTEFKLAAFRALWLQKHINKYTAQCGANWYVFKAGWLSSVAGQYQSWLIQLLKLAKS